MGCQVASAWLVDSCAGLLPPPPCRTGDAILLGSFGTVNATSSGSGGVFIAGALDCLCLPSGFARNALGAL